MGLARWRWLLVGAVLVLAACGSRAGGGGDGGTPDDGGSLPDSGSLDACEHLCFADFPCRNGPNGSPGAVCASATVVWRCETIPCAVVCGTPCCSGASCDRGETTPCPQGLVCFEAQADAGAYYAAPFAECKPPRDAGADADYAGWIEGTGGSYCW
jgi:hypothetical protein